MLAPRSRAFLFELVRATRPGLVLEIGTYRAGTSRDLADALALNQQEQMSDAGSLITLDPETGREQLVVDTIAAWPEAQRDLTTYMMMASTDFFLGLTAMPEINFDLMFVDGNHRHLAAFADLMMCARQANANAVVVVDDYNQPNVFLAVQDFLKIHPDWTEIRGQFDTGISDAPFDGMQSSLKDIPFLVLVGPDKVGLSRRPTSYSLHDFQGTSVTAINLSLKPGQAGGKLFANIMMDSVTGTGVDAAHARLEYDIPAGVPQVSIPIVPPLKTASSDQSLTNACEATLVWHGKEDAEVLEITAPPEIVVNSE